MTNIGGIEYSFDVKLTNGIASLNQISTATAKTEKQLKTLDTQATKTAKAVNSGLNQALTNTSYQIQDIAVQLAGGQNPFLVMAQQIPQTTGWYGRACRWCRCCGGRAWWLAYGFWSVC